MVKATHLIKQSIADPTHIFMVFMTLLLGGFGYGGIRLFWQQGEWLWASAAALLFAAHIALHWLTLLEIKTTSWLIFYHVAQTILITIILFLPYGPGQFFGVNFLGSAIISLMAEALGVWGNSRRSAGLILFYLTYLIGAYIILLEPEMTRGFMRSMSTNVTFILLLITLFNKQLEERKRAEELATSLESANQQLAHYADQVETLTLATERQRMARDLHDTLAQGVAGLILQLEAVKAHLGNGRVSRSAEIVGQALAQARSTLADSRAAIDDLRTLPNNFDEAVHSKVERFTQATGIRCDLNLEVNSQLPDDVSDHALHILSEALSNVTRHAQASHVSVDLQVDGNQLMLNIKDNGRGFDPETATRNGHYGLIGIRERARLIDGKLHIESDSKQGTRINLQVPLINQQTYQPTH